LNHKNWYVVQTKPHKEDLATDNLQRQGFTAYCPHTMQAKRRRQCWQKVIEPLFPRYLFVQLDVGVDNFAPIRSTLGVIGLVRFGNQPAVMPLSAIEAIQQQEQTIVDNCDEHPRWSKGDLVEILDGPFAGLRGIFQRKEGIERVSLLLGILGQENRLTINVNSLASAN
jgi:transcriptional antiterminator RfaH